MNKKDLKDDEVIIEVIAFLNKTKATLNPQSVADSVKVTIFLQNLFYPMFFDFLQEKLQHIGQCAACNTYFIKTKTNAQTCGIKKCASTLFNKKRLARNKR